MDRQSLLKRIYRTEECIMVGKRRIHEQQLKVYRLDLRGQETRFAKERLEDLQRTQARYEDNWRLLLDQLRK